VGTFCFPGDAAIEVTTEPLIAACGNHPRRAFAQVGRISRTATARQD